MIYDIIGDVHGQADKLIGLLDKLGYQLQKDQTDNDFYQPPAGHRALFIGDLIDRGNQELRTLQIAFAMKDAGVADIIMGNHEYNALAYANKNQIANDGSYLRPHSDLHTHQHQAFLAEMPFGSDIHAYWLSRFIELPLWLETPHACFVHACWDADSMALLTPLLTDKNCLTANALQLTGQKHSPAYNALEHVLKGIQTTLPEGLYILDKDGGKHRHMRVNWWLKQLKNRPFHKIARMSDSVLANMPADRMSQPIDIDFVLKTDKPVFIGHYWLTGTPKPLSEQVVCVDYSAAIDSGYLTCYQFDTHQPLPLSADNFVQYR